MPSGALLFPPTGTLAELGSSNLGPTVGPTVGPAMLELIKYKVKTATKRYFSSIFVFSLGVGSMKLLSDEAFSFLEIERSLE